VRAKARQGVFNEPLIEDKDVIIEAMKIQITKDVAQMKKHKEL
jgi:hypothetical protein